MARAKTGSKLYAEAAVAIEALTKENERLKTEWAEIDRHAQSTHRAEAAEARVAELEEALENMVNDPALVCSYVRLNAARAALARAAPTRGEGE
jgi:hypothetical protein